MRGIYVSKKQETLEQVFDSAHAECAKSKKFQGISDTQIQIDVISEIKESQAGKDVNVFDSVVTGMEIYKRQHGQLPTADVIDWALAQGLAATKPTHELIKTFDSVGSTAHHDTLSAMPNRVQVAITAALAEAVPFANYVPADINSNESRCAIITHNAGSAFGEYALDDIMDGANSGKVYFAAERRVSVTLSVGRDTGTAAVLTTAGGSTVPVLRGRTMVFVNGLFAAAEAPANNSSAATSAIAGTATIAGSAYSVSGTVTIATGAVSLAFSPALPVGTVVDVEAHIDYEKAPTLAPKVESNVGIYTYYASPWRSLAQQTIDSSGQYLNELGLDLLVESGMAIRSQMANERHYNALRKLKAIATAQSSDTFDFNTAVGLATNDREHISRQALTKISVLSQKMAEDTMDHGVTHAYVGKLGKGWLESLAPDVFVPSGVTPKAGIYRIGTLVGSQIEVYYSPRLITETSTSTQMLLVGRSTQPARCPIVMGDAIPATILPLAMGVDLLRGQAVYGRSFTAVNTHTPSALGAALLNLTNVY